MYLHSQRKMPEYKLFQLVWSRNDQACHLICALEYKSIYIKQVSCLSTIFQLQFFSRAFISSLKARGGNIPCQTLEYLSMTYNNFLTPEPCM